MTGIKMFGRFKKLTWGKKLGVKTKNLPSEQKKGGNKGTKEEGKNRVKKRT